MRVGGVASPAAPNPSCGPSAGDTKARKAMFRNMDVNGNGLLSVMEVERSTQKLLGEVNENFLHADLAAAFESAKTAHISRDKNLNNTLDLLEFRQFLGDVKQGFYNRFVDAIYTEGDGRMNVKEYVRFVNQLGVWGVDVPDAEQVYKDIDSERRGVIFWEEIKEWLSTVATDFDEAAISEAEQADTLGGGSIKMSAESAVGEQWISPVIGPGLPSVARKAEESNESAVKFTSNYVAQ